MVGNDCVIANNGTLAGHVTIEDKAVIGGLVAIHQFVRIGSFPLSAAVPRWSRISRLILPATAIRRAYTALNLVGLRRNDISKESIEQLNHAFKILFNTGLTVKHALERMEKETKSSNEVILPH